MVAKKRTATKRAKKGAKKGTHIAYNGTNFSKILPHFKGGPAVVINVLVHMDGCGPCQRLMGPYKKAVANAPSDAVNVSVERQQLEKFNEDLRKNVEKADSVSPNGFPTMIKIGPSGKILSAVNPSPSTVGSMTVNSPNTLNGEMEGIPSANNSQGPPSGMELGEDDDMDEEDDEEALRPNEFSENVNMGVPPRKEDDSMASIYNSSVKKSLIMSGGRAYAALAAAGHHLRKSKKTGRKTRHRKTRHRKTRKTNRRS
jgi:hypothetical protein